MNPITVSVVTITPEMIERVATKTERPVEDVRIYLRTDQQDDVLLRAFLFFGVGPFNKRFASIAREPTVPTHLGCGQGS